MKKTLPLASPLAPPPPPPKSPRASTALPIALRPLPLLGERALREDARCSHDGNHAGRETRGDGVLDLAHGTHAHGRGERRAHHEHAQGDASSKRWNVIIAPPAALQRRLTG
jgi:hypothetical protein